MRYQTGGSGFEIPDWGLFPRPESGQRGTTPLGGRGRPRCRPVSTGSGGVLALRYQTGALALRYQTGGCFLDPKVARGVPRHGGVEEDPGVDPQVTEKPIEEGVEIVDQSLVVVLVSCRGADP